MAKRAKYKVGQIVQFRFAGSDFIGEIAMVRPEGTSYKYNIIDDDGTNYPVGELNVIKKV